MERSDDDMRYWQESGQEREQMTLDALNRCRAAGARDDDLRWLAAELGVTWDVCPRSNHASDGEVRQSA